MKSDDRTRNKIIAFATQRFFSVGYSKVSTDELVSGLAMSKATLYRFFSSKEELLDAVIDSFYEMQVRLIEEILGEPDADILQKIRRFMELVSSRLSLIKREAIDDFKRTIPESYDKLMQLRKRIVLENLVQLFQQGVQYGLFRQELEPSFVMTVFLASVEAVTRPEYLSQSPYSYDMVIRQVFTLLLQGNLTEAGREVYLRSL